MLDNGMIYSDWTVTADQSACIIVGNGPSLKDVPLDFLSRYPTFGTNRCYLKFIPTYYVAVNPLVIEQNKADIDALKCKKYIMGRELKRGTHEPFSFHPLTWVHEGYTVTYVCMQLAYWMGYRTVLLVGVDHRYIQTGKPNEEQTMQGDDPNHFDPSYFKGQKWNLADLAKSEKYYRVARNVFENDGRRIINLTPNSALEVFEKGQLSEWA
jgi:hypothetical protein